MKRKLIGFLIGLPSKYILDELVITLSNSEISYFVGFMCYFSIQNYEINVVDGEIQIYMNDILEEIGIEPSDIFKD